MVRSNFGNTCVQACTLDILWMQMYKDSRRKLLLAKPIIWTNTVAKIHPNLLTYFLYSAIQINLVPLVVGPKCPTTASVRHKDMRLFRKKIYTHIHRWPCLGPGPIVQFGERTKKTFPQTSTVFFKQTHQSDTLRVKWIFHPSLLSKL